MWSSVQVCPILTDSHVISFKVVFKTHLKTDTHTNEPIYKTERLTDIENRLVVAKGELGREREGLGVLGLVDANYYI